MTHPAPPGYPTSPGNVPPLRQRPVAITLSIAGTALIAGLTLIYLIIVIAITYLDTHFDMNSLGWTLLVLAVIGAPLSIAAAAAAVFAGKSLAARIIAAMALVGLLFVNLLVVVAFLGLSDPRDIDDGAMFFAAWFFPVLFAIGAVATLVSYGFGWDYYRRGQTRR